MSAVAPNYNPPTPAGVRRFRLKKPDSEAPPSEACPPYHRWYLCSSYRGHGGVLVRSFSASIFGIIFDMYFRRYFFIFVSILASILAPFWHHFSIIFASFFQASFLASFFLFFLLFWTPTIAEMPVIPKGQR